MHLSKLILSDNNSASNSALQNYVQRDLSRSSLGCAEQNHLNTHRVSIKPEELKKLGGQIHNSNWNLRDGCLTKAS